MHLIQIKLIQLNPDLIWIKSLIRPKSVLVTWTFRQSYHKHTLGKREKKNGNDE